MTTKQLRFALPIASGSAGPPAVKVDRVDQRSNRENWPFCARDSVSAWYRPAMARARTVNAEFDLVMLTATVALDAGYAAYLVTVLCRRGNAVVHADPAPPPATVSR